MSAPGPGAAGRLLRRLRCHGGGATAVEFALVGPLAIALIVGTIETGRVVWVQTTLDSAVQAGARYAAVHGAASTETIVARARASVALDTAAATFTVSHSASGGGLHYVTVAATQPVGFAVPFTALVAGSGMTLAASARVPVIE